MAWGWVVRGLVGIVGSWWVGDDVIHALFASEAKRFLRASGGFVNLRIWAGVQAPPIGAGSAGQWRSGGVLGRTFCKFAEGGQRIAGLRREETGKFAEGQPLAPPEGKSCQLAWFRWWSAANGARGSTRDANLHIGDCCRKSAHGRNLSGWAPISKVA